MKSLRSRRLPDGTTTLHNNTKTHSLQQARRTKRSLRNLKTHHSNRQCPGNRWFVRGDLSYTWLKMHLAVFHFAVFEQTQHYFQPRKQAPVSPPLSMSTNAPPDSIRDELELNLQLPNNVEEEQPSQVTAQTSSGNSSHVHRCRTVIVDIMLERLCLLLCIAW